MTNRESNGSVLECLDSATTLRSPNSPDLLVSPSLVPWLSFSVAPHTPYICQLHIWDTSRRRGRRDAANRFRKCPVGDGREMSTKFC